MAAGSQAPLLAGRELWRRDPRSQRWLLAGVSVELRRGERLGLAGPSGSGKSLLLRTLALLDAADRGTVCWRGEPLAESGVPSFRSRVLYLQQRPTLIEGTVEENLCLPFRLRSHRGREYRRAAAVEILEGLGRSETLLEQPVDELSGGERQLVVLVRSLLVEPAVLLLDEPTAALDRDTATSFAQQVERWIATNPDERAYLWVAHQGLETDRTLRMAEGRLLGSGDDWGMSSQRHPDRDQPAGTGIGGRSAAPEEKAQ